MDITANAEAADPYCLSPGEAAELLGGHPWRRFVVVGDSVAEGLGDPVPGYVNLPWADRVAAELAASATASTNATASTSAGGSGRTTALSYRNLGRRNLSADRVRAEQLAAALATGPDLALIACGNDALRHTYDGDAVDREVAEMVTALHAADVEVLTVSLLVLDRYPRIAPNRLGPLLARLQEHADRTARLATALGTIHVDLRDHPGRRNPALLSADGLHANGRAHGLCAAAVVRRLGAHLRTGAYLKIRAHDR